MHGNSTDLLNPLVGDADGSLGRFGLVERVKQNLRCWVRFGIVGSLPVSRPLRPKRSALDHALIGNSGWFFDSERSQEGRLW
jgi:hypothetical protein